MNKMRGMEYGYAGGFLCFPELSLYGKKQLEHPFKHFLFCSTKERFGIIWR